MNLQDEVVLICALGVARRLCLCDGSPLSRFESFADRSGQWRHRIRPFGSLSDNDFKAEAPGEEAPSRAT